MVSGAWETDISMFPLGHRSPPHIHPRPSRRPREQTPIRSQDVRTKTSRRMYNPQHLIIQARASLLNKTPAVLRGGANGCCALRSSSSKFVALGISQRFVLSLTPFGDQPRPGELVPNPLPGRLLGARWQRARRSHPQKDPGQPGNSNCFAIREISGGRFLNQKKFF